MNFNGDCIETYLLVLKNDNNILWNCALLINIIFLTLIFNCVNFTKQVIIIYYNDCKIEELKKHFLNSYVQLVLNSLRIFLCKRN